jgi:hypothetical protein
MERLLKRKRRRRLVALDLARAQNDSGEKFGRFVANAILRKPYRALMQSVPRQVCNDRQKETEDLMPSRHGSKAARKQIVGLHRSAVEFAAKRGLRLDLTPAEVASAHRTVGCIADAGAVSATAPAQNPSRPFRFAIGSGEEK